MKALVLNVFQSLHAPPSQKHSKGLTTVKGLQRWFSERRLGLKINKCLKALLNQSTKALKSGGLCIFVLISWENKLLIGRIAAWLQNGVGKECRIRSVAFTALWGPFGAEQQYGGKSISCSSSQRWQIFTCKTSSFLPGAGISPILLGNKKLMVYDRKGMFAFFPWIARNRWEKERSFGIRDTRLWMWFTEAFNLTIHQKRWEITRVFNKKSIKPKILGHRLRWLDFNFIC